MGKLIIDGNSVYEIDEECMKAREKEKERQKESEASVRQWKHNTQKKLL